MSRQKRIVAKAADRHYSIPLNYLLKMCVVKKHGKRKSFAISPCDTIQLLTYVEVDMECY